MSDLDTIIGHLTDCLNSTRQENGWAFVRKDIITGAIRELQFYKDHEHEVCINCPYEPVRITWQQGKAYCGHCGKRIPTKIKAHYCHKCGRKVLWDG